MIIKQVTSLNFVSKPPQDLILTGSRFFETNNEDSDWDFFTADTEGIRLWLKSQGFINIGRSIYTDRHTIEVWRYFKKGLSIDIQIVKSVPAKSVVQDRIKASGIFRYLIRDKVAQKAIWDLILP